MNKFWKRLKQVGPGAVVAAAFIGPGTITTCTTSGASYGYTLLWALLFSTISVIVLQSMAPSSVSSRARASAKRSVRSTPTAPYRSCLPSWSSPLSLSATSRMRPVTSPAV